MVKGSELREVDAAEDSEVESARLALTELVNREPQRHPLVLGFVAAIGTPLDPILQAFDVSMQKFNYTSKVIHLASLIDDLDLKLLGELPGRDSRDYYARRMDACDKLRAKVGNGAALAALAIAKMPSEPDDSITTCFLLRSLKHPDEAKLLRHVYGEAFSLVGVACGVKERSEALMDSLAPLERTREEADRLIARDESDRDDLEFGQNVRDTYSMADVFIPATRGIDVQKDVDRFVDSIFGHPFLTPTFREEGMRFAQDAALRSASAGRQVGAALIPKIGTPVVAGTNEVPKPGGGQYWTEDEPDYRDFQTGEDPNPIYIRRVVQELLERLQERHWLAEKFAGLSGSDLLIKANEPDISGSSLLMGARINALIEFTRCLHAEQAAIVNAARSGISTEGAVLFSTTFPCHECAKLIIGAGVIAVHYIEPYPKSLVALLYRDMIETSPTISAEEGLAGGKVPFRQFLGIAPRRYSRAFTAEERREGAHLVTFDRRTACPRTAGWSEVGIEERESAAVAAILRVVKVLIEHSATDAVAAATEERDARADPWTTQDELSDKVG